MKLYPKIDLHVDGFYWTTTQRYPTLSKALQALKSQAPAYIQSGQPSRFLEASFPDSSGSRRIKIYENRKKKTRKKVVRRKRRVVRRNPARTNKAHFGYAKNGMKLLGTGLKIAKGERVYMTPATNIPGGGFFVEPAYRTGLWKQVSDGAILIKPKDFDDEITYVEPRGEYRPTPQVKPDYKYGIYTGRGIARNPRLGKYEKKALDFARKYPGWHGFDPRKPTANIVRRLEKKGLVKVSDISNQFRAI